MRLCLCICKNVFPIQAQFYCYVLTSNYISTFRKICVASAKIQTQHEKRLNSTDVTFQRKAKLKNLSQVT